MHQVRSVRPADAQAWLEMRCALWPDHAGQWHADEITGFFAGMLREPLAVLIALDEAAAPLGFAELSIRPYAEGCETDRVAYLEGWYVKPEARRRGIGAALVAAAEQWGVSQGCREFGSDALLDNEISAAAHRALGFAEVERIRCFRKPLMSQSALSHVSVQQLVPLLMVQSMDASLRFYVEGLGFTMTKQWIDDGKVRWCRLEHGRAALMLQELRPDGAHGATLAGQPGAGVGLNFICRDALAFHRAVRDRGIATRRPFVGNRMWVTSLADPDGYSLHFESPTLAPEETELVEERAD